jgi:uncharacterized membrane protein SirB2
VIQHVLRLFSKLSSKILQDKQSQEILPEVSLLLLSGLVVRVLQYLQGEEGTSWVGRSSSFRRLSQLG